MSNSFKKCPTHFSRGGEKFSRGHCSPGYGPAYDDYEIEESLRLETTIQWSMFCVSSIDPTQQNCKSRCKKRCRMSFSQKPGCSATSSSSFFRQTMYCTQVRQILEKRSTCQSYPRLVCVMHNLCLLEGVF